MADPAYEKYLEENTERAEAKKAWDKLTTPVQFKVHHGGGADNLRKTLKNKKVPHANFTWNVGDIDFDDDGSIFIRNPYLADTIMTVIAKNRDKLERGELTQKGEPQFLFRLTRDEGWSGEKQNMVC